MWSPTPVRRSGLFSTFLANSALSLAHGAALQTPASALILSGVFFRCLTLPCTLYGDRCLHRAAGALPELQNAYKAYQGITDHPRAIAWEKRVAAQKLKHDRDRIFRSHRTSNIHMTLPYMVGGFLSLYSLGVPAQQIGAFFQQDAAMRIVSPLALSWVSGAQVVWSNTAGAGAATLFTIDPTLALAAGLTYFNTVRHLELRVGFNDRLDSWIANTRRVLGVALATVAAGSLLAGPLAYLAGLPALHFFPPYMAPVWLGMSATAALKTILVNGTAPGRALFCLPAYPPQHGTYGGESSAAGHEYRLAFTGVDVEETRSIWQTQKRILDYECDVRLHRFLRRIGLYDDVNEMEYEVDKLQRKLAIARERRLARHMDASCTSEDFADRGTQAAQLRRSMRDGATAPSQPPEGHNSAASDEYVVTQMERAQEAEWLRRNARQAAREAAWKRRL